MYINQLANNDKSAIKKKTDNDILKFTEFILRSHLHNM